MNPSELVAWIDRSIPGGGGGACWLLLLFSIRFVRLCEWRIGAALWVSDGDGIQLADGYLSPTPASSIYTHARPAAIDETLTDKHTQAHGEHIDGWIEQSTEASPLFRRRPVSEKEKTFDTAPRSRRLTSGLIRFRLKQRLC